MRHTKHILSLVLAFVLVFGMIPLQSRAAQGGKLAAITFDDGPSATTTPKLLDGLKARGVKATFFMLGQSAKNNMDVVRRVYDEGHELASHSWNHPDLNTLSDSQVRNQLDSTTEVLDQVCGKGSYLLRAPYGNANSRVRKIAGVPLIYWTVDPEDWKYRNASTVRNNIVKNTYDGAIILVHDIYSSSVEGALMAIDDLQDQGYEFVTVSELHRRRNIPLENGEWHYSCKPNGTDVGDIATPKITYTTTDRKTMTVTIEGQSELPIYYTTDGSEPKQDSSVYSGPFDVPYGSTIKAYSAFRVNGSRSELAVLDRDQKAESYRPKLEKVDGKVVMTSSNADSSVYYTLDGSQATENSTLYTGPVEAPKDAYIHAVTAGEYYNTSAETIVYHSTNGVLFADVKPESWYYEPMDRMAANGLMSGFGNNYYEPDTKLSRAMLVTMLYAYAGNKLESGWQKTSPYVDVNDEAWYSEAVEWSYRNAVTAGYEDQTFRPDQDVSREELAVIIDKFLEMRNKPLERGESCEGKFGDYSDIHAWAVSGVEALVKAGLLVGDEGNVYPRNGATRAEVSAIISQMMDYEEAYQTAVE